MTLYDIFTKALKNSDTDDIAQGIIGSTLFAMGALAFITVPVLQDLTHGEALILVLISGFLMMKNVLTATNLVMILLIGLYVSIIDTLRWIKHKWTEL